MNKREYQIVREALRPILILGYINSEEALLISALQVEADKQHSIRLQLEILQLLFKKDIEDENNIRRS